MAMFGEIVPFITSIVVGLACLKITKKFFSRPFDKFLDTMGWLIGTGFSAILIVSATLNFFDPPAPLPAKVVPMPVPGQGPYSTTQPSPYK